MTTIANRLHLPPFDARGVNAMPDVDEEALLASTHAEVACLMREHAEDHEDEWPGHVVRTYGSHTWACMTCGEEGHA